MKNKQLMKSLTIATAATATFVAQAVAADEVVATETQTSAIRTENTATNAVTAEQVAAAKQTADTANTAVTAQEAVVADANSAKQTAQEAENQASQNLATAQTLAQNATPEAMAAADTAISQAEGTVTITQAELEQTQSNLASATGQAQVAQEQADQAQAESDSAHALVAEKQKKLDQLQAGNTDVTAQEAQAELASAQTDLASAKADVDQAQTAVDTAKEQDAKLDAQIADAKDLVDSAKAEEVKAETVKSEKEATVAKTEQQVADAQAQADAVKPVGQYNIKIDIPQDVKDTLHELMNYQNVLKEDDYASYADYIKALVAEKARLTNKMEDLLLNKYPNLENTWVTATSDDPYIVKDYTNLTQKDKEQLNQLFLDVLNAFRVELGLPTAQLDKNAIKTSEIKTAMYKEKHLSDKLYAGHDYDIIYEAESQVFGDKNVQVSENSGPDSVINNTDAFDYIKSLTGGQLLFDINEQYGHMLSNLTYDYFGVDFAEQASVNSFTQMYHNITLLKKPMVVFEGDEVYEFQPVSFKSDDSAYQAALTKVAVANIANKQAQSELAKAVTNLASASQAAKEAQDKYDALLAQPKATPTAEKQLSDAKSALQSAQVKLFTAEEVLKNVTASKESKAAALEAAKLDLATAQDKADELRTAYLARQQNADDLKANADALNHTVTVLESEVAKAKSAVEEAKAHKASLVDAQINLAKAQQALSDAKSAREVAETKYAEETSKLDELKAVYDIADSRYIELLNLYNLTQAAESPVNTKPTTPTASGETRPKPSPVNEGDATKPAEPSEVATEIEQPVSLKPILEQGHGLEAGPSLIPTKLDPEMHQVTVTPSGVLVKEDGQVTYSRVAKAQALPETGEATGALATVFGLVSLGLGLTAVKKRRKES